MYFVQRKETSVSNLLKNACLNAIKIQTLLVLFRLYAQNIEICNQLGNQHKEVTMIKTKQHLSSK